MLRDFRRPDDRLRVIAVSSRRGLLTSRAEFLKSLSPYETHPPDSETLELPGLDQPFSRAIAACKRLGDAGNSKCYGVGIGDARLFRHDLLLASLA
jgi:hypothetical protein